MLDRYEALRTQYASDLERLSFIVDGEVNITKENIAHCPFCDGTVVVQRKQGYIDAAKTEYSKIVAQSKDLEDAYAALLLEKTTIEQRISDLLASKNSIEAVINETLKPELASLKDSLAQYKYVVELESEIAFIQRFVDNKAADILKVDTTDDGDGELFDPKEGIQVIVAENEIPNIEYKDARIIRFTKEPNNGRYGFLADVVE